MRNNVPRIVDIRFLGISIPKAIKVLAILGVGYLGISFVVGTLGLAILPIKLAFGALGFFTSLVFSPVKLLFGAGLIYGAYKLFKRR